MPEIVSRKGHKGLAKGAKLEGIALCGLGVSLALFAGNFRRKGAKRMSMHSKAFVFCQVMPDLTLNDNNKTAYYMEVIRA